MKLIIDEINGCIMTALINNKRIVEELKIIPQSSLKPGNIFCGRVESVNPEMDAVFINLNGRDKGLLSLKEAGYDSRSNFNIGDNILVQVKRAPVRNKRCVLTRNLQLPGGFLVYLPGGGYCAVSKSVSISRKKALKDWAGQQLGDQEGLIVRTSAETAEHTVLLNELEQLRAEWLRLLEERETSNQPRLLLTSRSEILGVFNQAVKYQISDIVSNDAATAELIRTVIKQADISNVNVRHTNESTFLHPPVKQAVKQALQSNIYLPDGASLIFNSTESITTIDVNTAAFKKGGSKEEASFTINYKAAEEIAKQLRLRQTGGIILVDLLKMDVAAHRIKILEKIRHETKKDSSTVKVYGFTRTGLLEMSRKNDGSQIADIVKDKQYSIDSLRLV